MMLPYIVGPRIVPLESCDLLDAVDALRLERPVAHTSASLWPLAAPDLKFRKTGFGGRLLCFCWTESVQRYHS